MAYAKGDLAHFHNEFRDPHTDQLLDPPVVRLKYTPPGGATVTLTYGVDAALTKTSTGKYMATVSLGIVGVWKFRWETTGAYQGASPDLLRTVDESAF
jgi:hypothetical protein